MNEISRQSLMNLNTAMLLLEDDLLPKDWRTQSLIESQKINELIHETLPSRNIFFMLN